MILSAIQDELRRMCMGSRLPDDSGAELTGMALAGHSAAHYIATLGLWQCLSHTWPREVAGWERGSNLTPRFGSLDLDAIRAHLVERAERNDWTAPLRETKHPLLGNAGRRSLLRGVEQARRWLSDVLTPEERAAELDWILLGATPVALRPPSKWNATLEKWVKLHDPSGYWNLGTICPGVLAANGSPYGNYYSAWLAVLAWEALPWLDHDWTERAKARPRLSDTEKEGARRHDFPFVEQITGDLCQWVVPVWHEPIELRRMAVWFRGRSRHTGRTWSGWVWTRYHDHPGLTWWAFGLRRIVSEKTWEFLPFGRAARCLGASWLTRYNLVEAP